MEAYLALQQRAQELERENEELKAELAARTHNYEYWREYAESLKAAAITPEMRERIEEAVRYYERSPNISHLRGRYFAPAAYDLLRDLLGEQG